MSAHNMADLRQSLDDLDRVILSALGERARLSRDIVAAKSEAATSRARRGSRSGAP